MPSRYRRRETVAEPSWLEKIFGPSEEEQSTPNPDLLQPDVVPDWVQHLVAGGLRVAGPIVGATLGAGAGAVGGGTVGSAAGPVGTGAGAIAGGTAGMVKGGAFGGAISELLAQGVEPGGLRRMSVNPRRTAARTAVAAGVGGVPGGSIVRAGKPLASGSFGGALGYGSTAGYKLAEGEGLEKSLNPLKWTLGELALGPGAGAGISAGLGHLVKPLVQGKPQPKVTPTAEAKAAAAATAGAKVTPEGKVVWSGAPGKQPEPFFLRPHELRDVQSTVQRGAEKIEKLKDKTDLATVKQATTDTRPTTTRPAVKLEGPSEVAEGKGFSVTSPEAASPEDLLIRTGVPEEASAATLAAQRTANTRMLPNQINRARQAAAKAETAEQRVAQETLKAEQKAAQEAAKAEENARKLAEIEEAKAGKDPSEPRVSESLSATTPEGGRASKSVTWRAKEADEGLGDLKSELPPVTPGPTQWTRETAAKTVFTTQKEATEVAMATGGVRVDTAGRGKWIVRYPAQAAPIKPLGPPGPAATKFQKKVESVLQKSGGEAPSPSAPLESPPPAAPKKGKGSSGGAIVKGASGLDPKIEREVSRINDEMETFGFTPRTWNEAPRKTGNAAGGDFDIVAGSAGAEVYDDILSESAYTSNNTTRSEVAQAIRKVLSGEKPKGSKQQKLMSSVIAIGRARLEDPRSVSKPWLPHADEGAASVERAVAGAADDLPMPAPEVPPAGAANAPTVRARASRKSSLAERIAFAKKNFTPEANSKLDDLRAQYEAATDPVTKRGVGAMMDEVDRAERARLRTSQAQARGGPKDVTLSAQGAGQFKDILRIAQENPTFAIRLLGTVGGGATGAVMDEEEPLRGAAIGAGLGYGVGRGLTSGKIPLGGWRELGRRTPNYYKGGMLSHPLNWTYNALAGPAGSHFWGGLEHTLSGTPGGKEFLKSSPMIRPGPWLKRFNRNLGPADHQLMETERAESAFGDSIVDWVYRQPGRWMTTGDMTVRDFGKEAGFPEALTREITVTAEPGDRVPLFRLFANALKGKNKAGQRTIVGHFMMPFRRTLGNIGESGFERAPGLGLLVNAAKEKSIRLQWRQAGVQQGLGTAVLGLSYATGYYSDPTTARALKLHNLVSNLGGQYSMLASAGYAMGQAHRAGKPMSTAVVLSTLQGLPMPTVEPLTEVATPILKVMAGEPVTQADVPSNLVPKLFTSMKEMYEYSQKSQPRRRPINREPTQNRTFPNSRYRRRE